MSHEAGRSQLLMADMFAGITFNRLMPKDVIALVGERNAVLWDTKHGTLVTLPGALGSEDIVTAAWKLVGTDLEGRL